MTRSRSHKLMSKAFSDALQKIFTAQPILKKYMEMAPVEDCERLSLQLESLNADFFKNIPNFLNKKQASGDGSESPTYTPPEVIRFAKKGASEKLWKAVRERGIDALKGGKVAVVTVAGGQGTRLGHPGPKGTYPITPIKKKTLFQVFAEKILAAQKHYGKTIHWLIMTSPVNHKETCAFFEKYGYFGLTSKAVHFFNQNLVPAVDFEGNCLLNSPHELSLTPDGHGGFFKAFLQADLIEKMRNVGVDTLSYFQVDNPLTQPLDPLFIGFHRMQESDFSSKTVRRRDSEEKVGIFVREGEKLRLLEYSDAPKSLLEVTDAKKELKFSCANIAVHALDLDFVERVAYQKLPYHLAVKKIPYWDVEKGYCEPQEPNGIKFEQFLFDALPLAKNAVLLEVEREEAFSPVKNAKGPDSPDTCRLDQMDLWRHWLMEAGLNCEGKIEISPLWADSQEEVFERLLANPLPRSLRNGTVLA